jgi:hypothetical protein
MNGPTRENEITQGLHLSPAEYTPPLVRKSLDYTEASGPTFPLVSH